MLPVLGLRQECLRSEGGRKKEGGRRGEEEGGGRGEGKRGEK